jgi:hypothetical protein
VCGNPSANSDTGGGIKEVDRVATKKAKKAAKKPAKKAAKKKK